MHRQEVSHLGFPGAETLNHIPLNSLRGFASRDFMIDEYKRFSLLGIPDVETPMGEISATCHPGSNDLE
jgi:hypothetical protein